MGALGAAASGGNVVRSFVAAGIGSAYGAAGGDIIGAMIVAGTASEITGGKFANGAGGAALSYVLGVGINKLMAPPRELNTPTPGHFLDIGGPSATDQAQMAGSLTVSVTFVQEGIAAGVWNSFNKTLPSTAAGATPRLNGAYLRGRYEIAYHRARAANAAIAANARASVEYQSWVNFANTANKVGAASVMGYWSLSAVGVSGTAVGLSGTYFVNEALGSPHTFGGYMSSLGTGAALGPTFSYMGNQAALAHPIGKSVWFFNEAVLSQGVSYALP